VNDQPNFTSILDKPAESLEAPKPIPVGSYLAMSDNPRVFAQITDTAKV
jgi:hypothetical protein